MKSTRSKRADALVQAHRVGAIGQEKAANMGNPVELTRVKLQGLPDTFSSSMWSADGITRASRLYQRSSSTPPIHQSAAYQASRSFVLTRDDAQQSGMQLSYHLASASSSTSDAKDNQIEECEVVTPASIGMDIQRSWSAPPIADQSRTLEDNQSETALTLDTLAIKSLPSTLLLHGATNNANDMWSEPLGTKPYSLVCKSPDHSDTHVVSDVSYDSASGYSNQDSNASGSACSESSSRDESPPTHRLPPGLSLLHSVHSDFARVQAHDYDTISVSSSMYLADELESMAHLRICDQPRYRQDSVAPAPFGYSFSDARRARHGGHEYAGSAIGYQHSRALGRHVNQPAYTHGAPFSSPSPYAVHPYSDLAYRGRASAREPSNQLWETTESSYYRGSASTFGGPSHRTTGVEYYPKAGGIYETIKTPESLVREHRSYTPARAPYGFDSRASYQYGFSQPSALYRPKAPASRRTEHEYLHPVAHSYSSSCLLEEFSSTCKPDKWELSTIKGHLLLFARDQSGSRFIQQRLEKADDRTKDDVFEEIFPNALVLMTDVFGNYVIQKLFEHGSLTQQQRLVEQMRANMVSLALQVYGCRVTQRALEVTRVDEQLTLMNELRGHVQKCIKDQNGNHVLQKCIEVASWTRSIASGASSETHRQLTGDDIQFIIDDVIGRVAEYSAHSYGCRVIQRILEHCSPTQIRPIVDEIVLKCRDLMKDQFGNYVVQHVIGHGEPDQRRVIMDAVLPDIARWSQHKFASNVVEACLERATKAEISRTVDFILQCDETGASCPLLPMMKHMYGNYVVQKLLDKADASDRDRIVCIIRHNADFLKRFTFGKHVLSRLEREGAGNHYY